MVSFGDRSLDALADDVIPDDYFSFGLALLRDSIFDTDRMLKVKQRIFEQHRVSGTPLADHLLACLRLRGDEAVLDLGCGNGVQLEMLAPRLPRGRVVGLDVAPGVLEAARTRMREAEIDHELVVASADDLSMFADDSFDRVMANYMMHYVPDLDRCFEETRRVLRPGGRFLLTTNSTRSMVELYDLHFEALRRVDAPAYLFKASPKGRVSLENGAELVSGAFDRVELRRRPDVMRFTAPDPFLRFYSIGHNFCSASSKPDPALDQAFFDALLAEMRGLVEEVIARDGHLTVTKLTGTFVCE